ncbi:hypothetical protein BHE90_014598 [Fusarium euwallaceae]|uniref:Uncharacterized protein n=2 Tax=Fusarium solani species complex TaxID=232080 RepID=A0A428S4K4_9HYPO|nr:hypothetical protein CEP52_016349 [Fusarium oligoseptatum]RTE70995.1 hypothetical protein BHE90_014598 [Fusarium euwallaceae]
MDTIDGDKPRPPVAPPEPISPALSASAAAPKSALAKPAAASPTTAPTPDSPRAAPVSVSATSPAAPPTTTTTTTTTDSAPANKPASTLTSTTGLGSASAPRPASTSPAPPSPLPTASTSARPAAHDSAPSPAPASAPAPATGTTNGRTSPAVSAVAHQPSRIASPNQPNGRKTSFGEGEVESELSDPVSSVHSPSGVEFNEPEDEIVVGARANGLRKQSPRIVSDQEDETMADVDDEPIVSHYPKRKRTSILNDLNDARIEAPLSVPAERTPPAVPRSKPARQSLGSVKGVTIGYWRDSPAPVENLKHAVIGFIDVRERLRTRIQPVTLTGELVPDEYPLPPGPGGSWVTFERVVFLKHLVNLDHYQVKEFVRLRADTAGTESSEEERITADKAAVKEAIKRVKQNPTAENATNPPQIAYGVDLPEHLLANRDPKRRRTSGGFAAINPAPANGVVYEHTPIQPAPGGPQPVRNVIDPLPGTRPTRILLGCWEKSAEQNPRDKHAVYGILGQNDMFRVKLVRETRDGRFVDGNFPTGAGALWIPYEEVIFEPHLKSLPRAEIKEYCRVRQWQIDHGESPEERTANETKAVYDAQARVAGTSFKTAAPLSIAPALPRMPDDYDSDQTGRAGFGGHELRQSRRVEAARAIDAARMESRPTRQVPGEMETSAQLPPQAQPRSAPAVGKGQGSDAIERTSSLARREIARAEAAQGRADRHAANRERAVAAAADAANAAVAAIPSVAVNGRMRFHESEEMQRLNKVWARQETLRMKAGSEDAKIYGGVKYERKANGPFMGKLVSQGNIITIDGEDYVEYRVLTKPSFF